MIETLRRDHEIWDLFTKKEEYSPDILDKFDRFPRWATANKDVFHPHVSDYLVRNGFTIEYPEGSPFCICLTHDIDQVYSKCGARLFESIRHMAGGRGMSAVREIINLHSPKTPWWNFSNIQELEETYGARSTFFFKVQNENERDFSYHIADLEQEIQDLISSGWEVGFHGCFEDYTSVDKIREKREAIERIAKAKILGHRGHYLNFKVPDTWEILSSVGFTYDTTLGYADCVGFRNGMCHPFHPYNLRTEKIMDILEMPLIIMDFSLFEYMRLDEARAWQLILRLLDKVEKYQGVATILWHNTYMNGPYGMIYEKILRYGEERGAWMTGGGKIVDWWANHAGL